MDRAPATNRAAHPANHVSELIVGPALLMPPIGRPVARAAVQQGTTRPKTHAATIASGRSLVVRVMAQPWVRGGSGVLFRFLLEDDLHPGPLFWVPVELVPQRIHERIAFLSDQLRRPGEQVSALRVTGRCQNVTHSILW